MSEATAAVQAKDPGALLGAAAKQENPPDRVKLIFEDLARRAFEIFEGNGREFGHDVEHWFQAERELLHPVNIELTETEAAFEIKAEVPGFTDKELEINVEPLRVVIAGKHETNAEEKKKGKVVRAETCTERMMRVVDLPAPVETAKVTATLLKNGVLTLTLPKVAQSQPVRIKPAATA
jgi:HSP20 family protein